MLLIINSALMSMLLSHIHLKVAMLYTCALTLSSRFFHHLLGPWHHIMWHVMWLQCHVPLHRPKEKKKEKENKISIKSENKRNKRNKNYSCLKRPITVSLNFSYVSNIIIYLFPLNFSFSFLSFFCYLSSYIVDTMVYHYVLCNKLLILKNKKKQLVNNLIEYQIMLEP